MRRIDILRNIDVNALHNVGPGGAISVHIREMNRGISLVLRTKIRENLGKLGFF